MLTPYLPYPPASGGQIRTLNLLKYLNKKHEVTLVSLYKNSQEKKYADYLKNYCTKFYVCKRAEKPWQPKIVLKALFTAKPLLIVRNFSKEAEFLLKQLLNEEKFDVIHAETFYIMPHLPHTDVPILLVEQTIEYQVYQHFVNNLPFWARPFFLPDVLKLKYWEKYYWKKAAIVASVSELDQKSIKKIEPKVNPVIIANGAGDEMLVSELPVKNINNPTLLFQGNFFWLQNREAAQYIIKNIAPKLKENIPNCKIIIAGQETKRISVSVNDQVEIIEVLPHDSKLVKSLYQKATIFIAPIFGPGGTRLKILAAMASGLPVITTKTGVEGLNVQHKEEVLLANTPADFSKMIKLILENKPLYEKLRKNAHNLIKAKYTWSSISKKLEVVYENIIEDKKR